MIIGREQSFEKTMYGSTFDLRMGRGPRVVLAPLAFRAGVNCVYPAVLSSIPSRSHVSVSLLTSLRWLMGGIMCVCARVCVCVISKES